MTVKNDCFLVKRLELGYVFYIIKHDTKTDKDKVTANMENISGNEKSTIFDRSLNISDSENGSPCLRKMFGKQTFILAIK